MTPADIPQNTLFMISEAVNYFLKKWPKLGLGDELRQYFTKFEGDFSQMYYRRDEFDAEAEYLSNKMLKNPRWAINLINKVEQWSVQFMEKSRTIRHSDLSSMSDKQLIALYHSCLHHQRWSHGVGASISWHADAEKERVTKGMWRALESHLGEIGNPYRVVDVFGTLTTPSKTSYVAKEEISFLRIASKIHRRKKARKIFLKNGIEDIPAKLQSADRVVYRHVIGHHQSFCWLAYQYKGPATHISEYIGRWQELLKSKVDPVELLKTTVHGRNRVMRQQTKIIRDLRLTPYLADLVELGQSMVFIKDFRKDALYHGMYSYEPLLREIGRRLGLTIHQMWAMNTWEIAPALLHHRFDVDVLNARQKNAVAFADRKRYIIYTGDGAKKFLRTLRFEKQAHASSSELTGTPACIGKVTGIVKIINIPSEMSKMKPGDVMVAHNTNPNLVPAMKKAAALISEAGGLTCHTAIVARELQTPCIVGVAGAIRVLKDGDRVEVDATQGVVRKLNH